MPSNPVDAWLQMAQMKNQNRRQMYGDMVGIGQGLGEGFNSIGQAMQEKKKKELMAQIVQSMQTQGAPQQGPALPGQGMMKGMPPPQSGMGGPAQDNTQQIQGLMMKADPQGMMGQMEKQMFQKPVNPLQQSQIGLNQARADKLRQPGLPPGQMTPQQDLRKQFIDAINKRTDVQSRSLNARQVDNLAKTTGLQPTVVKQLQTNNLRADRALVILNDPRATWSALNGWVSTDFAGIMQGGAPQKEQVLESQFPNWRAKVSQIKTYMGSQPEGSIPEGFRDYMKHFVRGVKEIDNDYLWKNAEYQGKMIGPTIQGGDSFVKKSQDYTKGFMGGGDSKQGAQEDPLGIR